MNIGQCTYKINNIGLLNVLGGLSPILNLDFDFFYPYLSAQLDIFSPIFVVLRFRPPFSYDYDLFTTHFRRIVFMLLGPMFAWHYFPRAEHPYHNLDQWRGIVKHPVNEYIHTRRGVTFWKILMISTGIMAIHLNHKNWIYTETFGIGHQMLNH